MTSPKIVNGGADLLLAADEVVGASKDAITLCHGRRTAAVVNTGLMPVADFVRNARFRLQDRRDATCHRQNGATTDPSSSISPMSPKP